jgi:hypothetical protein
MLTIAASTLMGVVVPGCNQGQDDLGGTTPPPVDPLKNATEEQLKSLAKEKWNALYPQFKSNCASACHDTATVFKSAPTFLAGANAEAAYESIKKSKMITEDASQSPLVNKGEHEGPALNSFPELSAQVFEWLRIEAAAVDKKVLPVSDPVEIKVGPNEVDLSKLGVAGAKIKFTAALPGGILSLTELKIVVPPMEPKKGLRIVRPLFYRISKEGKLYTDVTDTFSYLDTVFAPGEATLPPGGAIFPGNGWVPFAAGDKIRIQVDKIEVGDIVDKPTFLQCKPGVGAMFNTTLGPTLTAPINCAGCHNGRAPTIQLNNAANQQATCEAIAGYVNKANPGQSAIILKLTAPAATIGHAGGKLAGGDATNFINAWTAAVQGTAIWDTQ